MEKQYRVVVPFGRHEVGDILDSIPTKGGETWVHVKNTRGAMYGILAEFISDKLEEVRPKALRKWLVEEVATKEEASVNGQQERSFGSARYGGLAVSQYNGDKIGGHTFWVKVTEQKEVPAEQERWVPKIWETYWIAPFDRAICHTWFGIGFEYCLLEEGLVFKTREECQAYIDRKKRAA